MEGSRPPGRADGVARGGFSYESAALLDEICLDHGRQIRQQILVHPAGKVGRKLDRVIEGEIVPRLMLLHASHATRNGQASQMRPADLASEIADFADLVIRHDVDVVEAYVRSLLHRGLDLETLLLHLLAPAARRLGTLWEADKIDFVDVTIGTSRLQQLLHKFSLGRRGDDAGDRRMLLIPVPGEQHTFGLVMVAELFRREGWQVHGGASMDAKELHRLVSDQSFVLIAFSLSCDRLINTLCSTIQAVRRLSRNQSVPIMVGGSVFAQEPDRRPWVGADIVAADAREALGLAESVLRRSARRQDPHHR
jgi:methanogenic corrinoid protein MtbC1